MKNIKCVIRKNKRNNDKEHIIYIRYTYNRRFILINTGVYVLKKEWNDKAGRVRKSTNYEEKNIVLENKEFEVEKVILNLLARNIEPTLINVKSDYYKVKNQFQSSNNKPQKQDEKKFLKDFKIFIDEKKREVKSETIKTYNTTYNKLKKFQTKTTYPLHYDKINNEFYLNFLDYLRKEDDLLDNSVDKHIKNLKLFMYWALSKERHNNNVFQTFKRTRTSTDFVVLEQNELRKLYYEYKTDNKKHQMVRDAFIMGCSTGLRFSDLSKLTSGNFIISRDADTNEIIQNAAHSYINVPVQKTNEYQRVPINHFIVELIEKYTKNKKFDTSFLNHKIQSFNKVIKDVCNDAGINQMVKISKKKNKNFVPIEKPKCDLVSSHTMRRTFISLLSTMTALTNIQAVSGHKDIKILTDYIKRSDSELNSINFCFNSNIFNGSKIADKEYENISDKSMRVRVSPGTVRQHSE